MPAAATEPIEPPSKARPPASPDDSARRQLYRALLRTAWIAALFCVVASAILLYVHFTATSNDPWKSPQLLGLKARLIEEPNNKELQQEIRRLDARFREKFRRRLNLDSSGRWLLLGGALALVAASRSAFQLKKRMVLSHAQSDPEAAAARLATLSRRSVASVGAVVCAGLFTLALSHENALPKATLAAPSNSNPNPNQLSESPPSLAAFKANFPRFRGWDGSGFSAQPTRRSHGK